MISRALALALLASLPSCGRSSGPGLALAHGIYALSPPKCASTDASPAYPAANYKAALFDLDELTAHTLEVGTSETVEHLTDPSCALTIRRGIFANEADRFSMRRDRRHTFEPAGCALVVIWGERRWPVAPAYTDLFADSTVRSEELPFVVTDTAEGERRLVTAEDPPWSELWGPFGCATADRLVIGMRAL